MKSGSNTLIAIGDSSIRVSDGNYSSKYPKSHEFLEAGVPFISANNLRNGRVVKSNLKFISEEQHKTLKKGHLRAGDVLLVTRGSLGTTAFVTKEFEDANINAQLVLLRADNETVDSRYLFQVVNSSGFQSQVTSNATGTAQPQLPIGPLKRLTIPLPAIDLQRKIAGILSAYDDLIENNLRRIKILEEMAQSLYREWFVHFRFPGHESAKFVDSPLGQIPKGWEWGKVGDAFEIQGGGTPSTANEEYWVDGDIQWYSPRDLTAESTMFIEKSAVQINELGLKKSSAKMFPAYSVMLTSRATIGAIAINTGPACTNQGFITCLPNAKAPLYFLHQWLKANVETFILHASGSTFKEISKGVFKGLDFLQPNAGLLQRYEQAVSPVADRLLNLQRSNQTLRRTRDLLLPKLLSGG
jgi:type I restriction enzyme, S subunit